MTLSFQKYGNLYRCKEVLHVHEEVHERLDIKSTNNCSTWQFVSFMYHQPPNEWEEDSDNDEVEYVIS
jgi:hypothetical protein